MPRNAWRAVQENDLRLRSGLADLAHRLDAVQFRHRDVDDDHVRFELAGSGDQFAAVTHRADHVEILVEKIPEPLEDDQVVIGQQDPRSAHADALRSGTRTWITVPLPGTERIDIVPCARRTRSRMLASPIPGRPRR